MVTETSDKLDLKHHPYSYIYHQHRFIIRIERIVVLLSLLLIVPTTKGLSITVPVSSLPICSSNAIIFDGCLTSNPFARNIIHGIIVQRRNFFGHRRSEQVRMAMMTTIGNSDVRTDSETSGKGEKSKRTSKKKRSAVNATDTPVKIQAIEKKNKKLSKKIKSKTKVSDVQTESGPIGKGGESKKESKKEISTTTKALDVQAKIEVTGKKKTISKKRRSTILTSVVDTEEGVSGKGEKSKKSKKISKTKRSTTKASDATQVKIKVTGKKKKKISRGIKSTTEASDVQTKIGASVKGEKTKRKSKKKTIKKKNNKKNLDLTDTPFLFFAEPKEDNDEQKAALETGEKIWEERYDELCLFQAIHGHCDVPTPTNDRNGHGRQHEEYNNGVDTGTWVDLGTWVHNQRLIYRLLLDGKRSASPSLLSGAKIEALEVIGCFNPVNQHHPTTAAINYNDMNNGEGEGGYAFAPGVVAQMAGITITGGVLGLRWVDKFAQLLEFREVHGHCMVSD